MLRCRMMSLLDKSPTASDSVSAPESDDLTLQGRGAADDARTAEFESADHRVDRLHAECAEDHVGRGVVRQCDHQPGKIQPRHGDRITEQAQPGGPGRAIPGTT